MAIIGSMKKVSKNKIQVFIYTRLKCNVIRRKNISVTLSLTL